jgi:hypothetical protein
MTDELDRYLDDLRELRAGRPGRIPTFSVRDGRTKAKVLFLFQDPGHSGAMKGKSEVDRDNDDDSARMFKCLNEEAEFDRKLTMSWNAVPWEANRSDWKGEMAFVRKHGLIPKLLDLLPALKVVVLCGKGVAQSFEDVVAAYDPALLILKAPHPSYYGLMPRGSLTREDQIQQLREAIERARDYVEKEGAA